MDALEILIKLHLFSNGKYNINIESVRHVKINAGDILICCFLSKYVAVNVRSIIKNTNRKCEYGKQNRKRARFAIIQENKR